MRCCCFAAVVVGSLIWTSSAAEAQTESPAIQAYVDAIALIGQVDVGLALAQVHNLSANLGDSEVRQLEKDFYLFPTVCAALNRQSSLPPGTGRDWFAVQIKKAELGLQLEESALKASSELLQNVAETGQLLVKLLPALRPAQRNQLQSRWRIAQNTAKALAQVSESAEGRLAASRKFLESSRQWSGKMTCE
jgi:hypothetical protein